MKRKKILKEGYQIPYDVSDFKSGDRIHVTGDFDDVSFDNFATVIATTNDIDNPYEDEDGPAILVRIDEPNEHYASLHSGGGVSPEVRAKCARNCWWIWMYQFSHAYPDRDGYRAKRSENLIVRLDDDDFPNAYDVISSLYESKDLLKENYINPGIEFGDEVIVSFDYTGENPFSVRNELAIVLGVDDNGWMLLEFKDWHKGHNGHHVYPGKCRSNNCFFVNDGEFFGYLHIRHSNIPDAYDVISSLYESKVLTESRFIHPSVEVGDDVIVSFQYVGSNPTSAKNEFATVLDVNDNGWWLLKFKNWHHGNNAHGEYPNDCYNYNCFYVKDHDRFSTLDVRPVDSLGIPNAYDVISSLYESEDLDWAMNMASDISKSIITPGQYYRINGKIAYYPFDDTIDIYIKAIDDDEVIVYDVISVGGTNWSAKDEKVSLKTASKLVNDNYWMPISKEESLFNKKRMDESEDFDWAMDMAKNIDDNQLKLLEIPKKRNGYYNVILLDKPDITYQTIANIVDYINEKTSWKSTLNDRDIKDIHNNYTKKGFSYINLRPNNHVSYGSSEDTFASLYDMDFSDPQVKVIRPYSYNETIKESEEEFNWAMDMAKDIENRGLKLLEIPTKMNGYYNVILFDKPGITKETIEEIVNYIEKNTEWKFSGPESTAEDIYYYYMQDNKETYINLKPEYRYPGGPGSISFGHGEGVFTRSNDRNFSDPSVKIIRPYSYDETIKESEEEFNWAMDMAKDIEKNLVDFSKIPTKANNYYYLILFDKPGITKKTIEEIVNYIEKYTEWKFSDSPNTANNIYGYYKNDHNMETYINLRPKTTDGSIRASYGSGHDVFREVNKVSFNSPQVKIIRPY